MPFISLKSQVKKQVEEKLNSRLAMWNLKCSWAIQIEIVVRKWQTLELHSKSRYVEILAETVTEAMGVDELTQSKSIA